MTKSTFLKALAAVAAGVLAFSCNKTPETELSLTELAANFEAAGTLEKTISVTSNVAWTVSCPDAWVTVSPKSGEGNGSFKISVTENTAFETRSSTVTVQAGEKSALVKVSQLSPAPSLLISEEAKDFGYDGGTLTVTVTSNAPWTVSVPAESEWVSADPVSGEGNGTVTVTVAANAARETRTAQVSFRETVGGNEKVLTINQEMGPATRQTDSLALVAIFNATNPEKWKEDRLWDLSQPIDTWYGIKLSEEGRVTTLKCLANTITEEWTLPEAIGELTELTDLRFNNCAVSGELPEALYTLTQLQYLYFSNNKLTGSLSSKLGDLTELTELYIDQNPDLTGSLPKEIGNLTKLMRINISQSGINGAVPAELGNCTSLLQFMAFKSKLEGELPDIWDLPELQTVMVHTSPGLTGNLPASLGKLKPIVKGTTVTAPSLQLYGCNFTGNIPESFAELHEKTKQVYVQENKMSGVVPAAVTQHPGFANWKLNPQQEGYGLTVEE